MSKITFKVAQDGDSVTVDGVQYACTVAPVHDLSATEDGMRIAFGWEPSTTCNSCSCGTPHEIPGAERVAFSVQEAIEKGWLSRA